MLEEFIMEHLRIRVSKKHGKCPHNIGETWDTPYALIKPAGKTILCDDAHYVLIPYLGMAAGGDHSWETDGVWRIHCPSKTGIIFEIEALKIEHQWPENSEWSKKKE
jgi:uncharacterized repeat protein (TIGR04076 family)